MKISVFLFYIFNGVFLSIYDFLENRSTLKGFSPSTSHSSVDLIIEFLICLTFLACEQYFDSPLIYSNSISEYSLYSKLNGNSFCYCCYCLYMSHYLILFFDKTPLAL